jgi:L-ascorbate metabolism protein UlaG (beta-lactamase superfamily)
MTRPSGIQVTWLGHSTFKITSASGKTLLIDPWLANNPACPAEHKSQRGLDLMLLTHGHFDHFEDAVGLAREHRPAVVANFEICQYLESEGVGNTRPMNKGGSQDVEGIRVTMVPASHSSSIRAGERILPGGEAVGYVLEFENGFKVYDAGDTTVFGDMQLIAELYRPDLTLLPIGDRFTMGPREAALACRLMRPRRVIPHHYGTFPVLTGTVEALRELTRDLPDTEILSLRPGGTWDALRVAG